MHATFTEEEYNKLKMMTDGVFVPTEEVTTNPDPLKFFTNNGDYQQVGEPYRTMSDTEVTAMVTSILNPTL